MIECDFCGAAFDPIATRWRCTACGGKANCCEGASASFEGDVPEGLGLLSGVQCIDDADLTGCVGLIRYRRVLSGTMASYPRCEKHWSHRLELEER